jgi:hypothetical protein
MKQYSRRDPTGTIHMLADICARAFSPLHVAMKTPTVFKVACGRLPHS